ncbi:unnamed protein product [Didymodactylos carnosus]|uniref:Uncharacterized protein n=1 Tax=Didymodactylos carnosus TaxID=1234261 RepID=A0A814H6R4_9BILA|nr:unnamed protein product [Didymodactylos carnosus]CAF1005624.1 unnamed protein product [Didymodactylos carnosus]CAF3660076.1 unnamed protein product [Didymodactylos carnosus]CAF3776873.1 unnamed protein product [Didymodactylos carnosus]
MHPITTATTTKGQGITLEIVQAHHSVPFHLLLTNKRKFGHKKNQYWIMLSIDDEKLTLQKLVNGRQTLLKESMARDSILQIVQPSRYKYWLSIDFKNFLVKYGQGEMRNECTLFSVHMRDNDDKQYLTKLKFSYSKFLFDKDEDESGEELNLCHQIYKRPVEGNSPILVSTEEMIDDQQATDSNKIMIAVEDLDKPNQRLYKTVVGFKLSNPKHPHFTIAAIESSCREPPGWCYTTLQTKANALTRGVNSTSIRIRIGNLTFLEIWPPNHKSTVIQHSFNTHGIIRILSNPVMIEFHPYISANPQQKPFLARLCEENEVLYFKPGLNQIYRFFNPRNTLAIIIQTFDTVAFEYIGSDRKQIKRQSEVSTDIEYEKFIKLIEKDCKGSY